MQNETNPKNLKHRFNERPIPTDKLKLMRRCASNSTIAGCGRHCLWLGYVHIT